jgi:hypothetical protein
MSEFRMVSFLLQATVVIFSLFAGGFWLAAAAGRTVVYPWQWEHSRPVPPEGLADHQTKWNARAALCACIAAFAQAFSFLLAHPIWPPW